MQSDIDHLKNLGQASKNDYFLLFNHYRVQSALKVVFQMSVRNTEILYGMPLNEMP